MNQMIGTIPPYLSKQISDMVSRDPSIINLSIGEPYFKPPLQLYDNFKRALFPPDNSPGLIPNKYADSKGDLSLRREIATRYRTLYGIELAPESNILVTHGASEAIWLSILTLTSLGDEVIIPDPSYMMYEIAVKMLGRIPLKIPTSPDNGFCLTVYDIKQAITPKTKLIIINSPENPTGAVYDHASIKSIHDLAKESGMYFVHDEVYDSFVFDGAHENIFRHQSDTDDTSVLINSFSKKFSMMGWRLGWTVGSQEFITNATKIHTNLTLNLGSFHQAAAATILNDEAIGRYFAEHVEVIKGNVNIIRHALTNAFGFELSGRAPKGAFFLFPGVSKIYPSIPEKYTGYATRGESVSQYLLAEHKIAVVPGIIYGKAGSDYIRIAAAVDQEKAIEAARRFMNVSEPISALPK